MGLTQEQKDQINILIDHRDSIVSHIFDIEQILKTYFPEEFDVAYQHWIPQIVTALYEHEKWLPRGTQTMQNTIDRLLDKVDTKDIGVQKFI